jgi:hypothetical protein
MRTYISWDTYVEKDEKIVNIPESSFECPKLNVNDIIFVHVKQRDGENLLTPVKVTHIHIGIGWDESKGTRSAKKIEDADQCAYVSPIVVEAVPETTREPARRRRINSSK